MPVRGSNNGMQESKQIRFGLSADDAPVEVPPGGGVGLMNDGVESSDEGGSGGDISTERVDESCGEMSDVPPDEGEDVMVDGRSREVVPPEVKGDEFVQYLSLH